MSVRGLFASESDSFSDASSSSSEQGEETTSSFTPGMDNDINRENIIINFNGDVVAGSNSICSQAWPAAFDLIEFFRDLVLNDFDLGEYSNQGLQLSPPPLYSVARDRLRAAFIPPPSSSSSSSSSSLALNVLELGAGLGISTIGLLSLLSKSKSKFKLKNVTAISTDLEEAIDGMKKCVEENKSLYNCDSHSHSHSHSHSCLCLPLMWGGGEMGKEIAACCESIVDKFNVVIASDCVYWAELHTPFLQCLKATLAASSPNAVAVITGVRRWKRDTKFYKRLTGGAEGLEGVMVRESINVVGKTSRREIKRVYVVWLKQKN